MKTDHSIVVSADLLNELGTLAAPSMLKIALQCLRHELGCVYPETMALQSYRAEFKQGAREGDTVQVAYEEVANPLPRAREFQVQFSKSEEKPGRVGDWRFVFADRGEAKPLAYGISQYVADQRSDRELWRPDPVLATGVMDEDAQALLWLAGQSSRRYMKRLDEEFAHSEQAPPLHDDVTTRIYGGVAVVMEFAGWAQAGEPLRCVVDYQPPLLQQTTHDRKMVFAGKLIGTDTDPTHLIGSFRFTVVRLNAQRASIYPHGSTQPTID